MAKRFTATEIWSEDWFLEMPTEYKLFWYYMLTACDHAGIFKVNVRSFCGLNGLKVSAAEAISFFNAGKQRIRLVSDSVWFIEDFFVYQYGDHFNVNNPLHRGVKKQLDIHEIELSSIRGLKEVNLTSKSVQKEDSQGLKDKDKEKDKDNSNGSNTVGTIPKEEGGMGETEEDDLKLDETMLAPRMLTVFKNNFPKYAVDTERDFGFCLKMAYKICKEKGWTKYSAKKDNLEDVLLEWRKVVEFIKNDSYYSGLSIDFLNRQWSGLSQKMSKPIHNATNQQTTASSSAGLQSGSKSTSRINAIATAGIGNRNRPS
jgi:hypothetical protein